MITQYPPNQVGITYEHQKTHEGRYFLLRVTNVSGGAVAISATIEGYQPTL